jgi:nucleoside-diphosphate-sugar epimerase
VAAAQVYTTTQVAEMIQAALPGTRIVTDYPSTPHVNLRLGYLTNDRLRADTGFGAWTPFPEGLRQTIAWAQAALAQPDGEVQ